MRARKRNAGTRAQDEPAASSHKRGAGTHAPRERSQALTEKTLTDYKFRPAAASLSPQVGLAGGPAARGLFNDEQTENECERAHTGSDRTTS